MADTKRKSLAQALGHSGIGEVIGGLADDSVHVELGQEAVELAFLVDVPERLLQRIDHVRQVLRADVRCHGAEIKLRPGCSDSHRPTEGVHQQRGCEAAGDLVALVVAARGVHRGCRRGRRRR